MTDADAPETQATAPSQPPQAGKKGLKRIVNAFFYSMNGIKASVRTEDAFRQEIILSALMIPLSFFLADSPLEWALLNGSVLFVLIVELLNTGIERTIDRISFERHELSKEAKDMGSAAVLLSLILCGIIWGAIIFF